MLFSCTKDLETASQNSVIAWLMPCVAGRKLCRHLLFPTAIAFLLHSFLIWWLSETRVGNMSRYECGLYLNVRFVRVVGNVTWNKISCYQVELQLVTRRGEIMQSSLLWLNISRKLELLRKTSGDGVSERLIYRAETFLDKTWVNFIHKTRTYLRRLYSQFNVIGCYITYDSFVYFLLVCLFSFYLFIYLVGVHSEQYHTSDLLVLRTTSYH
jgi:hypothetical protein